MIETSISAALFIIIGVKINANVWYWLLLGLLICMGIIRFVLKQVKEKYDKDINKSIMEFSDKVIKHNCQIIELSERISALNGDVLNDNKILINDNKILIDELKRGNNK